MRVRIVRDGYSGFEVQVWRWWFPFWVQPKINTHSTVERAENFALRYTQPFVKHLPVHGETDHTKGGAA